MRFKLKHALLFAACLCMLLLPAACASEAVRFSLDTVDADENGAFVPAAVPFGVTVEEAEEALGTALLPYMQTDSVTAFQTEDHRAALGEQATPLYLEFQDGRLYSMYTRWQPADDPDAAPTGSDFDALYARAVELFGAPTTSKVNEPLVAPDGTDYGVAVTEHIWVRETPDSITQCHLVMDTQGGAVSLISLILNTRPPDAAG